MTKYKYHEYIDEWFRLVETGEIRTCKEQKQLVKFLKKELDKPNVHIRSDDIYEAVALIEKYFPFKLIHFQKFFYAIVTGIYYDDGTLVFDEFLFFSGRGAGKNGLISTLIFYLISSKNNVKNYDVDIVATSEKQSSTSFFEVYDVIKDNARLRKSFNLTKVSIKHNKTNSRIAYCTSNAKTHDGGRPGAIIFDECHEYVNYENINVHKGGLGKKSKPRTFYITTDGSVRESVLDDLKEKARRVLDGEDEHNGFFPFIFKLDNEKEVDDPANWEKAVPRVKFDKVLFNTMKKQYQDMLYNSELKAAFLTKRMNLPKSNEAKAVAEWEEIKDTNQPFEDFKGFECIGALDFADLKDFCSAGLLFKKNGKRYFKQHTFIHEKSIQSTKFNIDINEAVELGLATIIREVPIIPADIIVDWFKKNAEHYSIKKVVADRYRFSAVKKEFEAEGIIFEGVPSGYITHNKLHPLITKMFADRTLIFGDDKLMRWYVNNCYVQTDSKGNKSYHKIEPIKRKTDGFFCFLHAMSADDELVEQGDFMSLDVYTY
ncbi:MAG: terminase large subunit [Clostridia bacterium]|nr:terminase large subunit [Clostridia bacterium]